MIPPLSVRKIDDSCGQFIIAFEGARYGTLLAQLLWIKLLKHGRHISFGRSVQIQLSGRRSILIVLLVESFKNSTAFQSQVLRTFALDPSHSNLYFVLGRLIETNDLLSCQTCPGERGTNSVQLRLFSKLHVNKGSSREIDPQIQPRQGQGK